MSCCGNCARGKQAGSASAFFDCRLTGERHWADCTCAEHVRKEEGESA